jgi:hypothetical protein
LKQFRKGKHFVLICTICIQTLYKAFNWDGNVLIVIDSSVTIQGTVQGFPMHRVLTLFV